MAYTHDLNSGRLNIFASIVVSLDGSILHHNGYGSELDEKGAVDLVDSLDNVCAKRPAYRGALATFRGALTGVSTTFTIGAVNVDVEERIHALFVADCTG